MIVHAEMDAVSDAVMCPYPPTPQNSLFFYINDPIKVQQEGRSSFVLQPRAVIVGPQLTRVTLDIGRSHKAVRVGFHPGGLHRLLGCSLEEIIDGSFDAADVFGREICELNERLPYAESFGMTRDLVEEFLLKKITALKNKLPFDMAMLEIVRRNGHITMEQAASIACLSIRQFERISKERIGFSPKLFARLVRFSGAYRLREQRPDWSWTSIAHEAGYFDQMHFIRDFKQFAGVTPRILEHQLENSPVRLQAGLRL